MKTGDRPGFSLEKDFPSASVHISTASSALAGCASCDTVKSLVKLHVSPLAKPAHGTDEPFEIPDKATVRPPAPVSGEARLLPQAGDDPPQPTMHAIRQIVVTLSSSLT